MQEFRRFICASCSICAIVAGIAVASLSAGQSSLTSTQRVNGWRGDIDTVVAVARRVHAGPTKPAQSTRFSQAAAELRQRVPSISDARIAVELQRLLAMLGDGHSLVYPAATRLVSFNMLPVELYLFEDGLYIVGGEGAARTLIGSRIERFGLLTVAQVLQRMEPFVSHDNAMAFKSFVSLYLVTTSFLEAMGATRDLARVSLGIVDPQGRRRTVTLEAGGERRTRRRLFPPPDARDSLPMYLREPDRHYWLTRLPAQRAIYMQFNRVGNAPAMPLRTFAMALRDSLKASGADRLIVDVRHNGGGNNGLLAPLVAVIDTFAQAPGRRVYIITGRGTFSAAQNFINRVERRVPFAIFAGEPSMSSPNFTGEDNTVSLVYSGLFVSISNRYWQDSSPDDMRPWITPQLPVTLRGADWLANRDPVLAAVLADLRRVR